MPQQEANVQDLTLLSHWSNLDLVKTLVFSSVKEGIAVWIKHQQDVFICRDSAMTGGRKACYISPLTNLIVFYLLYWFQIDIKIKENEFIAIINFPCTDKGQTVPTCSSACLSFSFA